MSDNRIDSQGCSLQIKCGSPSSYVEIGELADIPEISEEYSERDRTTLADTSRQIHQGFPVISKFDVEVAYNSTDTAQLALIAAVTAKSREKFMLEYSDSPQTKYYFDGKVMRWSAPYVKEVDSDAMVKFTIAKISLLSTTESTVI
jgi:hypothetical protein